jgi:hypothetical protein
MQHTIFKNGKYIQVPETRLSQSLLVKPIVSETKVKEPTIEKLGIDFEVYKRNNLAYGIQEKYLQYEGKKIGAKAIIKNEIFVNIVGRMYKVIPNEDVLTHLTKVSTEQKLSIDTFYYGWRMYSTLTDEENKVGIIVSNSIDGTVALRCDAMLQNDTSYSILVGTKIKNIYRRHSANLEISKLSDEINSIHDMAIDYKAELSKLDNYAMKDYAEPLKALLEANLPDIYSKGVLSTLVIGRPPTVKDCYETISNRIWNRDIDMKTKLLLFKKLNDIIMSIGIVEAL